MRTKKCTPAVRAGRLEKAQQFLVAAQLIEQHAHGDELTDACITLCVHAGIAAADVACCARLGEHARGPNHDDAVDLLAKVDRALAKDLARLLGMKTRSGYGAAVSTAGDQKAAVRSAAHLVNAATEM
jgi:hypothetical protein